MQPSFTDNEKYLPAYLAKKLKRKNLKNGKRRQVTQINCKNNMNKEKEEKTGDMSASVKKI